MKSVIKGRSGLSGLLDVVNESTDRDTRLVVLGLGIILVILMVSVVIKAIRRK